MSTRKLKPFAEIIQWSAKGAEENINQQFGLTPEGHIFAVSKPALVLGFKEGLFGRREGAHVNLQWQGKKDKKDQRWDFVVPVSRKSEKEADAGSVKPQTPENATNVKGTFPNDPFFIKTEEAGTVLAEESKPQTQNVGGKKINASGQEEVFESTEITTITTPLVTAAEVEYLPNGDGEEDLPDGAEVEDLLNGAEEEYISDDAEEEDLSDGAEEEDLPDGFWSISRYKNVSDTDEFPKEWFFIKSSLHGLVFD
ncbi:hypothetical protein BC936DRAFT_143789, partial [Jimgerdemannia flammicorona]